MAATLTEPTVLAAAKDTLYPDLDTSTDLYAVTETQFTKQRSVSERHLRCVVQVRGLTFAVFGDRLI